MAYNSAISWTDSTWNPIIGCTKISAGCANCYAEKRAFRLGSMEQHKWTYGRVINHCGDYKFRRQWNGTTKFIESALTKPLHWRNPRKIFVVSMGDLFHESVPFEWIDEVVAVVTVCHWHQFFFLTKRPGIMKKYFTQPDLWTRIIPDAMHKYLHHPSLQEPCPGYFDFSAVTHQIIPPLPNLHLGVTVENQDNVGRVDDLVRTPAAKRFISIEPMLEYIAFRKRRLEYMDYVYLGCESNGPAERLCTRDDMMHQMKRCWRAGVKVHVKQIPLNGKCNKNFDEWPKEFQVREV